MKKIDKMTAREQVLMEGMIALLEYKSGNVSDNEESASVLYDARYVKKLLEELDETLVYMQCQVRKIYGQAYARKRLLDEVRSAINAVNEILEKKRISEEEEKICAEMF